MPGNRKIEVSKTDSRRSALAGQRPCPHVTSCHDCYDCMWILPHPTYPPDMAPSDFYLLKKMKSHLRGTQYVSNEGVIEAVNEYLGDQEKA